MTALWVTLAVIADGAIALIGGVLPDRWLLRERGAMLAFASGALLAAALLDLVPEALHEAGPAVMAWLLAGLIVVALFEAVLTRAAPDAGPHRLVAPVALLGSDALHNFGDGIAIAAAFTASTHLGLVTSVAVLVHELPEELADYAVLRGAGIAKGRSLLALAAVQLTAGLGAAATLLGLRMRGAAGGYVLAVAAGTFLYIACADLMPEVLHAGPRRARVYAIGALVLGAVVIALAS